MTRRALRFLGVTTSICLVSCMCTSEERKNLNYICRGRDVTTRHVISIDYTERWISRRLSGSARRSRRIAGPTAYNGGVMPIAMRRGDGPLPKRKSFVSVAARPSAKGNQMSIHSSVRSPPFQRAHLILTAPPDALNRLVIHLVVLYVLSESLC